MVSSKCWGGKKLFAAYPLTLESVRIDDSHEDATGLHRVLEHLVIRSSFGARGRVTRVRVRVGAKIRVRVRIRVCCGSGSGSGLGCPVRVRDRGEVKLRVRVRVWVRVRARA